MNSDRITCQGPKGQNSVAIPPSIELISDDVSIRLKLKSKQDIALYGLTRALVANVVEGVSQGFTKKLEIQGIGFRAKLDGPQVLELMVGYSHPVKFQASTGVELSLEKNNLIKVFGVDKQLVGQTASDIRALKPPDRYKGKGIRYFGEMIKLKPGKAAKSATQ